ncbi:MAG: hypothetical protein J1F33_03155 [Clostridiales bacterium]|nr:hypothetical protein [Clostridiales bacterium]
MSDKAIIILCSVIALAVLGASVTFAVLARRNLKRIVRILGAGVFLMLVAMIFPSYSIQGESYALGLALVQSMCAMLLNADAGAILSAFDGYTLGFIDFYKGVVLALLIIAPLFTVGITLSFFSDKFTRLLYRIRSSYKPTYLFSEINERTLCAAEDIARKNKKPVIVFAVRTDKNDVDAGSLDRIKSIGASIISDDIVNINHSLKRERNYYMFCADSTANLDAGLRLYKKYNGAQTSNVNMWIYTNDEISEVIFDHLYETFNVRLINEEKLIARRLVSDYPLYNAVEGGKLSVLVVGSGSIGLEIVRVAAHCSCLGEGVEAEINVVDMYGDKAQSAFDKTAPSLREKMYIKFHTADINSSEFTEILGKIKPTYIVLALGNLNRNLETAIYIRRFYGMENGLPHIHALVDHKRIEEQILPNLCVSYWTYDEDSLKHKSEFIGSLGIKPFGSYEETYSDLRISASYLDCLAVAHNAAYCGVTELNERYTPAVLTDIYNQVIFFKDFSDGFAVSIPYKLHLLGLELTDDGEGDVRLLEEKLSDKANVATLRAHENKRYEVFMRGNGWTDLPISDIKQGRLGDKLKKKNARLDNRYINELTALTGRDFDKEDELPLYNMPIIIKLANALYGKNYSVREIKKCNGN